MLENDIYTKIANSASKWWCKVISNNSSNDDSVTATQLRDFQFNLSMYVLGELQKLDDGQTFILGTDYAPCKPLYDIAQSCNINVLRFPAKVTMEIGKNFCNVRTGQYNELTYLYATEQYLKDLIKVTEQNLKYWEAKDETFFEKWSDFSKMHIVADAKAKICFARNLYDDYKTGKLKFEGDDLFE